MLITIDLATIGRWLFDLMMGAPLYILWFHYGLNWRFWQWRALAFSVFLLLYAVEWEKLWL